MAYKITPDIPSQIFTHSVPFPRSYWVVPGKLLAGYYPGSKDKDEAHLKLRGLLDHGIRYVINLMEPDEFDLDIQPFIPYEDQMRSIAESMGIDVSFDRMPMRDMMTCSRIGMIETLDRMDESIEAGKPVYIHCWAGIGRTGTVVGCYLTRHGYAFGNKVLELIQDLRKNTKDHKQPSPQSSQQIEMILSWVESE